MNNNMNNIDINNKKTILLSFHKLSGAGNDFIIIDNRKNIIKNISKIGKQLCERKKSIGADGCLFICNNNNNNNNNGTNNDDNHNDNNSECDFMLRIINADGSEPSQCGNGCRVAAFYSHIILNYDKSMIFKTHAGLIKAYVCDYNDVSDRHLITNLKTNIRLHMSEASNIKKEVNILESNEVYWINTGVPHSCIIMKSIDNIDIVKLGSYIRYHKCFQPEGCNVNFIQIINDDTIHIRTYERGVENETLACGTGAVASSLVVSYLKLLKNCNIVTVQVKSGDILKVHVNNIPPILEGPAEFTFEGKVMVQL